MLKLNTRSSLALPDLPTRRNRMRFRERKKDHELSG